MNNPPSRGQGPRQHQVQQVEHHYAGPIPPPASMEHYERILPGLADRIVKMAEQAQAASLQMEKTQIDAVAHVTRLAPYVKFSGLLFAFLLCILLFVGTYMLLMAGKTVEGALTGLGAVVYSIALFLSQKKKPGKEKQ